MDHLVKVVELCWSLQNGSTAQPSTPVVETANRALMVLMEKTENLASQVRTPTAESFPPVKRYSQEAMGKPAGMGAMANQAKTAAMAASSSSSPTRETLSSLHPEVDGADAAEGVDEAEGAVKADQEVPPALPRESCRPPKTVLPCQMVRTGKTGYPVKKVRKANYWKLD